MLSLYVGDEPVSSKSHVSARGFTVVTAGVVGVTVVTSRLYFVIGNKVCVSTTFFKYDLNLATVF